VQLYYNKIIIILINIKIENMAKKILYQDDARRALEKGMGVLSEAVSVTLGPKGRNVVIENKRNSPEIINDGVSIAKQIELEDHIENTGVLLIRQAAAKTNDVAGDGTTTSTVLAYSIVKEGMKNVAAGSNPILLKRGIEKTTKYLVDLIMDLSKPIENIESIFQVATISAGNDNEPGRMIANALEKVGRDGVISLEEGNSTSTILEITEGMRVDKGFISPYFMTDLNKMQAIYENAYILVSDKKITLVQQEILPILELVATTKRPLLIIAEDIEKDVLATLILNKLRGIVNLVAIRAPGFGEQRKLILEDISILTGATLITDDTGNTLENFDLSKLGEARKIVVDKDTTTIISSQETTKKDIVNRCEQLRKQINLVETDYDKEKLQNRIARLSGGVAIIKVGAVTETEMKDKKLRLEDAINATRAAVEEGIVPGGGSTLAHLSDVLKTWVKNNLSEDELIGGLIIVKSILEPLKRIAQNCGKNGTVILEYLQEKQTAFGYDAAKDEFVNMYSSGIIDPAKVTRSAIQNAASIASMILTTECIIVNNS
jgi:chaperonin GroEL